MVATIWPYARRIIEALVLWAIWHGIVLWLGSIGIHPDQWVDSMITGATHAPWWLDLVISGSLGLVSVFLIEKFVWRRKPLPAFGAREGAALATSIKTEVEFETRYMTVYETIHYLADESEWGAQTRRFVGPDGMRKNSLLEAPVEFRRLAEQGSLEAFGRLNGAGTPTLIPNTYWMVATLNGFSLLNPDISETQPAIPNPDGVPVYKNVKIVRADVERHWPRCVVPMRIQLLDLLHEAAASGWALQDRAISQRFAHGIRQSVTDGSIEIWGLDLKNGWDLKSAPRIYTSEKIIPVYFKDHWIEITQALAHNFNGYARTSRPAGNEPRFFADLYVNRTQALQWLRTEGINLRDLVLTESPPSSPLVSSAQPARHYDGWGCLWSDQGAGERG